MNYKRQQFESTVEGIYIMRFVASLYDEEIEEYTDANINAAWQLWKAAIEAAQPKEVLEELYCAIQEIVPEAAHVRFSQTGKWARDNAYAMRGKTGTIQYRSDDMVSVYAAMDRVNELLK